MKIKITPWSTASFILLFVAIGFAGGARERSVAASATMIEALRVKMETGSDAVIDEAMPVAERLRGAARVFRGIGLSLAGLGLMSWIVSLAREKRDASFFPALLLLIYALIALMLR